ncbi:uncharacterized protein NKAPD1-like [Ruditapes philippinarum]|uniref:uncharacterized protein NKAPD1-like n=1 Tax=Ruditapes philippinarum TaxID=129788 RepID=UPI00295AC88D|nr:uncharacterized protein NKAPD1-like [Ruditapes philippinarum]
MSEKKILSTVSKTLIKNVIRHTDSHNKVVEESEMWRQREKELGRKESPGSSYSFLKDRGVDMRYEFPTSRDRRAHMDEEPRSTYWMKELYKAEEADNNRWGHSGYKEMYPEHFSRSNSSSSSEDRRKDEKHRDRHRKSKKVKRKKSRKREHSESDTDSESEDERDRKKRKKKHKSKEKKKKRKHKKRRHRDDSDS